MCSNSVLKISSADEFNRETQGKMTKQLHTHTRLSLKVHSFEVACSSGLEF